MESLDWGDEEEDEDEKRERELFYQSLQDEKPSYFSKEDPLNAMARYLKRISEHQWWIALAAKVGLVFMLFTLLFSLFISMLVN